MECVECGRRDHSLRRGMCRHCYDIAHRWAHRTGRWPDGTTYDHSERALVVANPWAGRHACPKCGSATWTLPQAPRGARALPWLWRAVCCHLDLVLDGGALHDRSEYAPHRPADGSIPARLTPVSPHPKEAYDERQLCTH